MVRFQLKYPADKKIFSNDGQLYRKSELLSAIKSPITIMNFTHVYEHESFLTNDDFQWIDCTDINGTSCYCDCEAEKQLTERIKPYSCEGIHFIDSGNYHYVSKFWIDKIKRPFSLIVFDHHPDMQSCLFKNFLSCGCWVRDVLDNNQFIQKVCIVGVSEKLIKNIDTKYDNRLIFYSDSSLYYEETWKKFANEHIDEPVYLSIDKDVMNANSAITNWDQGSLTLTEVIKMLSIIIKKQQIIGVDICGECPATRNFIEMQRSEIINNRANKELVNLILNTQNALSFAFSQFEIKKGHHSRMTMKLAL